MEKSNPLKLANELKKTFDKLIKMNDQLIANLPIEHQSKIQPIQKDIHGVLRAVKKGDQNKINEISNKYANSDSK